VSVAAGGRDPASWARRTLRLLGRLLVCILAAGLVAVPLAVQRGLADTEVHDVVGVVPATFTLSGSSTSQLRLGLLGNLYSPASRGPLGIVATVDGPPPTTSVNTGIASYFSKHMLEVYAGLFHDPQRAIAGYEAKLRGALVAQILTAEVRYAVAGGVLVLVAWLLLNPVAKRRLLARRVLSCVVVLGVALTVSVGIAALRFSGWAGRDVVPSSATPLPSLIGTIADGTRTDSPVLRLAIEGAIPKLEKLIDRQSNLTAEFVSTATASLRSERALLSGPRTGEVAVMMQSDMHCSTAMIRLQRHTVSMLDAKFGAGAVSLLAISGDLTTNGTAAEGGCIEDEARIGGDAPVAAVTGNHESEVSADQMAGAGMTVLDGKTKEVGGVKVLGAGDPQRTEMFGATRLRGEKTEQSVGADIYRAARGDRPDLVLLHEGYAVESFIGSGVADMTTFLDGRGSTTDAWDDGIRDLPAGAVFYGHWHRIIEPRVVWNSDGTWTLVMELNTSGGAIASPTLNHFSTPWSPPQQTASFPVVFLNADSGLVTGYQIYTFGTDGKVTVEPRVEVGSPIHRPGP
jgi:hypothetical protein